MTQEQMQTAYILDHLGYKIDKNGKFKLRSEHTASASINPRNGKIKDFGSGWGGSVIDLMVEFHGYSKKVAFDKFHELSNQKIDLRFDTHTDLNDKTYKEGFITQDYIDKFQKERLENFSRFWELLSAALPTATKEQKETIAKRYQIGYSKKADRLIMPICDEFGNCLTLWKYNKNPAPFMGQDGNMIQLPKLMFSKNRRRCPFNMADLVSYRNDLQAPIFLMEGEKDCLNALAKGLRTITLGSASAKVEDRYLNLFKDANMTICYDHDEAGANGAKTVKQQLTGICKNIEIIDWERIFKKLGWPQPIKKGFDYTDYLVETKLAKERGKQIQQDTKER